jgi:hypothetical protein
VAGLKWVDVDGGTGAGRGVWGFIVLFGDREIEEGTGFFRGGGSGTGLCPDMDVPWHWLLGCVAARVSNGS